MRRAREIKLSGEWRKNMLKSEKIKSYWIGRKKFIFATKITASLRKEYKELAKRMFRVYIVTEYWATLIASHELRGDYGKECILTLYIRVMAEEVDIKTDPRKIWNSSILFNGLSGNCVASHPRRWFLGRDSTWLISVHFCVKSVKRKNYESSPWQQSCVICSIQSWARILVAIITRQIWFVDGS